VRENSSLKVSEMTGIASILGECLARLSADSRLRDNVLQIADSLTLPTKILKQRLKEFNLIKKQIHVFYRNFVSSYHKSAAATAADLYRAYNISRCNVIQTSSTPHKRKPTNSVYFCFRRRGYSILCKSAAVETGLEWKTSVEISRKLHKTIFEGIGNEAQDRISAVLTLLKCSLNRIHQIMKNPAGVDQACLRLNVVKLKMLFQFRETPNCYFEYPMLSPSYTTILFSFMRIVSKINLLEKILLTCSKQMQIAQKKFHSTKRRFCKWCPKLNPGKRPMMFHLPTYTTWGNKGIQLVFFI